MSIAGAHALRDSEIRKALLQRLARRHEGEGDVAFLEELGLCRGQVFVDVAVVNGALHGYEIKSDRDSLRRLQGQVTFYGRVLDRATLVVGQRHLEEATEVVPEWWEIQIARVGSTRLALKRVRAGRRNPVLDPRALAELLWLEDALGLLAARDAIRGYRGKTRRAVWDRVCEVYTVEQISEAVRSRLKARAGLRSARPSG